MNSRIEIVPIKQKEANAFVKKYHRHHKPVVGSVSRRLDNGWTLEVNRLCTNGYQNACSMLYSAAWRVAKNLGYRRLITYILDTENGASLKASNWKLIGETPGKSWSVQSRPRIDTHPIQRKLIYEAV